MSHVKSPRFKDIVYYLLNYPFDKEILRVVNCVLEITWILYAVTLSQKLWLQLLHALIFVIGAIDQTGMFDKDLAWNITRT